MRFPVNTHIFSGHSKKQLAGSVNRFRSGGLLAWLRWLQARKRVVFPLTIKLPDQTIENGYGAHWPCIPLDLEHYAQLASVAGFRVLEQQQTQKQLYLHLQKTDSS